MAKKIYLSEAQSLPPEARRDASGHKAEKQAKNWERPKTKVYSQTFDPAVAGCLLPEKRRYWG